MKTDENVMNVIEAENKEKKYEKVNETGITDYVRTDVSE